MNLPHYNHISSTFRLYRNGLIRIAEKRRALKDYLVSKNDSLDGESKRDRDLYILLVFFLQTRCAAIAFK